MKCKRFLGSISAFFVIMGVVFIFGCESPPKTPPEASPPPVQPARTPPPSPPPAPTPVSLSPFTAGILNRLQNEAEGFNVGQLQFFLSGGIMLEKDNEEESQRVDNGTAVFIDKNNRKEIVINERTEGEALSRSGNDIYVCFDQDDNNKLLFSASGGEISRFFLKYTSQNDPLTDARGSLDYGGQSYRLKFTGIPPYLMIKLTEKKDPVSHRGEASGRKINSAGASEAPMPLTVDILNRMKRTAGFDIGNYQFILSGGIILERFDDQKKVTVLNGGVIFEDNPTSWNITVKDKTEGLAKRVVENRDETNIYVCFDQDDRNQLIFSASGGEPQFILKSVPLNDPLTDAKGSLEYGGQIYRLRYSGGMPFLQISLRQEGGATTDQHTAPGRRVGQ